MSKEDIDKAVKEAEQFAAEDKKQREAADVRNQADQMVFQTEKTLEEMGGKIDAADRSNVESALGKLKETLKGNDTEGHQERHRGAHQGLLRRQREALPAEWPAGPAAPTWAARPAETTAAPMWWTRTTPW